MSDQLLLKGILEDPYFWALFATALFVVLAALYDGGWRYLSGFILGVVNLAFALGWLYGILLTLMAYYSALTAPPGGRAMALAWAIILTGASLLGPHLYNALNTDETRFGRFLKRLKPEGWR